MAECYYYQHHAADPYFNMAFDDSMLVCAKERPDLILLRTYSWGEPAITIGVNQSVDRAILLPRLGSTPLIRRVTGGRAIYHDRSELTYAVAVNLDPGRPQARRDNAAALYLQWAKGLQVFLEAVGVAAQLVKASSRTPPPITTTRRPCFASAARYELMASGSKIVASAQRQVGSVILQHGSIKLHGVASHPGLPAMRSSKSELQPIDISRFESLARQLTRALAAVIEARLTPAPAGLIPSETIRDRVGRLRIEPLKRRDIFEQSRPSKSL